MCGNLTLRQMSLNGVGGIKRGDMEQRQVDRDAVIAAACEIMGPQKYCALWDVKRCNHMAGAIHRIREFTSGIGYHRYG